MGSLVRGRLTSRELAGPLLATVVISLNLGLQLRVGLAPGQRPIDVVGISLAATAWLALVGRVRYPAASLAVVSACVVAYSLADYPYQAGSFAVLVALYFATRARRYVTVAVVVVIKKVLIGASLWSLLATGNGLERYGALMAVLTPMIVVASAMYVNSRRDNEAELLAKLASVKQHQAAEVRSILAEQRLGIARDLHDTLAHHLAVISVQSGAALHVLDNDQAGARRALHVINNVCREVVSESKQAIAELRMPMSDALPDLESIVRSAEAAGIDVSVNIGPEVHEFPDDVSSVCHRVIQEAVTNTMRHSDADQVSIQWKASGDTATVEVVDDGKVADDGKAMSPALVTAGHGLTGMSERVTALGGWLRAERVDGGGFVVRAEIPTAEAAPQR